VTPDSIIAALSVCRISSPIFSDIEPKALPPGSTAPLSPFSVTRFLRRRLRLCVLYRTALYPRGITIGPFFFDAFSLGFYPSGAVVSLLRSNASGWRLIHFFSFSPSASLSSTDRHMRYLFSPLFCVVVSTENDPFFLFSRRSPHKRCTLVSFPLVFCLSLCDFLLLWEPTYPSPTPFFIVWHFSLMYPFFHPSFPIMPGLHFF